MNRAGLSVNYDRVLTIMRSIAAHQRQELRAIEEKGHHFVAVYDSFEQKLGVQDQRSYNVEEFCGDHTGLYRLGSRCDSGEDNNTESKFRV